MFLKRKRFINSVYLILSMGESRKPSVTVDILVFKIKDERLKILLIKRGKHPFKGKFAIPGGFVEFNEPLKDAAMRELFEETSVKGIHIEQFYTFSVNIWHFNTSLMNII